VDDVTWGALTLTLTVLGALWTWVSFQRRGLASGLRALAFTLLPLAAYLTKTLQMFTRILDAVADWATSLAFNPFVWLGVVVAGVSALLFVVSGFLRSRQLGGARSGEPGRKPTKASRKELPPASGRGAPAIDDDLAEIEALLRKRGIS
jgi:heme exporter protein D